MKLVCSVCWEETLTQSLAARVWLENRIFARVFGRSEYGSGKWDCGQASARNLDISEQHWCETYFKLLYGFEWYECGNVK